MRTNSRSATRRGIHAILVGIPLWLAAPASASGQPDEGTLLEAIRTNKLQVTDEMIDAQRRQRPELNGLSNEEIRRQLQLRAGGAASTEEDVPVQQEKKPDVKELAGGQDPTSRFPTDLPHFGYDFFSNNSITSASNAPALPEYILAPGDEIQVYTWGRETQNQTTPIDNEGMWHFPMLQPMRLAGMKFADAQRAIIREIEKINGVKASVGLGKLKSIRVFVLGEANNPGSYTFPAGSTVTTALFRSGGITRIGSMRGVQLKRNGAVIARLDLYDMLLKGNNRADQQLLPGDVIFVPVAAIQVAVTGKVKRPAIYEVKPGTKVLDAMDLAGGLSSNAFKGRIRLDRVESHKRRVVLDIGMERMAGNANAGLQDGDILHVEEVLSREYDVVYLQGNVNRPGRYEFKKSMTIRDLIPSVKDLKSETFFNYGHIKRSTEDEQGALLIPFSLADVFEKDATVPLMPRDTVIIYSKFQIMDEPEVKISGWVRKPGTYPYVEEMRISDLVIAGGGLNTDAYLPEAHLIRMLQVEESDSLFSTLLKVNLTHLIENPGDENNIRLRPSDSLIIFPRSNFILPKWVSVNGAVKNAGTFELTQNMGIPELISQANGLTKTTYLLRAEVVRKIIERDSVVRREIHQLNLKEIQDGRSSFILQDGDAVYVREVVDRDGKMVVVLAGEFNFPGRYAVAKGERLSSVIRRAGGFTGTAYLQGAVFIRRSVKELQLRTIEEINRRLKNQANNMLAQTTNEKDRANIQAALAQGQTLVDDIKSAPYLGRIVISLRSDLEFDDPSQDISLEDSDSLYIGAFPNVVSIMGEVYSPTNVIHSRSTNSIGECLGKAGGVSEYGDAGNIYYVQPDGSIVTPKTVTFFRWHKVEPGGTIIVPPKGPKKDYLDALAKVTQIIYQVAISVGVVRTLF